MTHPGTLNTYSTIATYVSIDMQCNDSPKNKNAFTNGVHYRTRLHPKRTCKLTKQPGCELGRCHRSYQVLHVYWLQISEISFQATWCSLDTCRIWQLTQSNIGTYCGCHWYYTILTITVHTVCALGTGKPIGFIWSHVLYHNLPTNPLCGLLSGIPGCIVRAISTIFRIIMQDIYRSALSYHNMATAWFTLPGTTIPANKALLLPTHSGKVINW